MKISLLCALIISAVMLFVPVLMDTCIAQEVGAQETGAAEISDIDQDVQAEEQTVGDKIDEATNKVDSSEQAQNATNNILTSIKTFGSAVTKIPGFYWISFAMMAAGFVSFLGQLVLGKLIMLTQLHFSMTEILSDLLGLLVSSFGLVLLTQAATSDGQFIDKPSLVLSASIVGAFFGLIFYFRGQTQELREARALRASRNKNQD